jgi:lysozyme
MKLGEKQDKKVSPLTTENVLGASRLGKSSVIDTPPQTMVEVLGSIYDLLSKIQDYEKLQSELDLVDYKLAYMEEQDRNKKIIEALGGRKPKRKKKPKKVKEEQQQKEAEKVVEKTKPETKPAEKAPEAPKPSATKAPEAPKPSAEKVPVKEAPKPEVKAPEKIPTKEAPKPSAEKVTPKIPTTVTGGDKGIMEMIKIHEGVRTKPYKDSLGLWTVGVGHLIGDGKSLPPEWDRELSMKEVDELFAKDYMHHKEMATKTPGWDKANETGQAAMIDLAFNMGGAWYKKWPNTAKALESGDFNKAADGLKDSKWYTQVKGRAVKIVDMIRNGGKESVPGVPTNQSLPTSLTSTTGDKINSASNENKNLKADIAASNQDKSPIIVNNNKTTTTGSSSSGSSSGSDDTNAYLRKLKG